MCVAAVAFQPVSLEYLLEMESSNPHGGGVAWQAGDSIQFYRGLTAKEIFKLQEDGAMTYPYLLHFRWATHGARVGELTHPFPTGARALMGEIAGCAPEVIIHNGTWSDWEDAGKKHLPAELQGVLGDMSDTAVAAFITAYNPDVLDEVPWATAHAFMRNGQMDITTRGTWSDHQGNWYSNLNWLPTTKHYMSWPGMGGKDHCSKYDNPYRIPDFYDGHAWGARQDAKERYKALKDRDVESVSWEQYVRAKYGDEAAEELNKMMTEDSPDVEVTLLPEYSSLVSEDFADVNAYLEKHAG